MATFVGSQVPYAPSAPFSQIGTGLLAFVAFMLLPLNFARLEMKQKVLATIYGVALVFLPLVVNAGLPTGEYESVGAAAAVLWMGLSAMWPLGLIVLIITFTSSVFWAWRRADRRRFGARPHVLIDEPNAPLPWGLGAPLDESIADTARNEARGSEQQLAPGIPSGPRVPFR
ncbi:hypothetical protein [Microbacterium sp. KSW4-4]|uniref:hypothetical protein n=1 Tax=Microbacterium sp. KSW4-4 TaxID=2851651 RepID=UPI001FFC6711|nr:hypothetical protein [Microbacterium sp. KSW4-4]MCK2032197.1 hypothetical protein [Microbacterium sp. KSW4-4]